MPFVKTSSLSLKRFLFILIVLIFLPILAAMLVTGFRQYQQVQQDFEIDTGRIIDAFMKEQVNISARTQQLLMILSHVPAVNDLDIPQCNSLLQNIHKENPQYSTIVVSSGEGLIDCCAIPLKKTINVADRSWFKRIAKERDFIIDNFLISRSAKKASLPFAYPIFDKDGNLKAAIGAAYNLAHYNELFEKIDTPKDYQIILTDRKGIVLYQSAPGKQCLGNSLNDCHGFDIPLSDPTQRIFEAKDGEGIDQVYMFDWLQVGRDNNEICFLIAIPRQKMVADVLSTLFVNLTILALIGVSSLLIAWFASRKFLLTPINSLIQKINDIKQGTWVLPEEENSLPLELNRLSTAFDEMVVDLSKKEKERDKALAEAEQELQTRKQVEKDLTESEEHLKVLFEQASDPIYVCEMDGRLINVNTAACVATGYSEEELLQLYVTDLDVDHSTKDALGDLFASILPGKHIPLLSVHRKKDGTTFPVEITIARIETPSGARIMGIARDITERIQIEERSKQTQKMESVGRLAGGIAHDLNNLLTPILGYAELMKLDGQIQEQTKSKIEHILKAGTGARDLVSQLLAFSRKQVLEYKPLNINQVLDGFESLIRRTIREDIEITISKSPELPLVMADIGQLEQVIMNLSVNAAYAMPEGGTLSIETSIEHLDEKYAEKHQGVTPGKHAMISFSDTGHGMDKETLPQIFEPFFSTKGKQGTGLGLSTVYGIIKQHNGNIWVYSEPGIGTTFKIYLPVLGEEEGLLETQNSAPATKKLRGSETILLVEDNEQVRETVYDILKQQGYTILRATGGEEAITTMASTDEPVHLLLTDVVMPDMNGKQLYETLSQTYPSLKVLYMSGYTNDIIVHHGVLDNGVQLIQKPFTNHSILSKVREVIDI